VCDPTRTQFLKGSQETYIPVATRVILRVHISFLNRPGFVGGITL